MKLFAKRALGETDAQELTLHGARNISQSSIHRHERDRQSVISISAVGPLHTQGLGHPDVRLQMRSGRRGRDCLMSASDPMRTKRLAAP